MANINEYLIKIQELTQTNLEILNALNESFFTKQNHISVEIEGSKYAIPSFISLENKINLLNANLENLINSPESGEAFFNFDGNSRSISVRPYTHTPNSLILEKTNNFAVDRNDIFKDFLTPTPYVTINLQTLPNDITKVVVKKIIPIHNDLINLFKTNLTETQTSGEISVIKNIPSCKYLFSDIYKVLAIYKEDVDYISYDTIYDLPIRKNIGSGTYVIEKITEDTIDENLDNYITLKIRTDLEDTFRNSLSYLLFDETIEKSLKIGDKLLTYEGNALLEITSLDFKNNTMTLKVLHGEYVNMVPSTGDEISSLSKLRFYSPIDFDEDKFVKIPLEEDQYIFIAVAPLNSRMNVQSSWGSGLMFNTYMLKDSEDNNFYDYYMNNVSNIGDILFEMTTLMDAPISKYTLEEFQEITSLQPIIDTNNISVMRINKHLDNSPTLQKIRSLYSQKKSLQVQLEEIENKISNVQDQLSKVSYDDTTGIKSILTSNLNEMISNKNSIISSISSLLNEISLAANNSEVPIEDAKYRIRGFFDFKKYIDKEDHIRGIQVQYRYKNENQEQGQATSIGDNFIFSDWNIMRSPERYKIPYYSSNTWRSNMEEDNSNYNEPSFNQIDIPISQGETVDIRLRILYDFGWPFVFTSSSWSPVVNIKFPEEYVNDIQVIDIIEENNNEIETYRFTNIINEQGVPEHIGDKIIDQDLTYFHKPENIASGFYTQERRIIPLKDKLASMDSSITEILDTINGTQSESLIVSIKSGKTTTTLMPYQTTGITVLSYDNFYTTSQNIQEATGSNTRDSGSSGGDQTSSSPILNNSNYEYDSATGLVTTILNLSLYNNTDHILKLYSIFPGDRDKNIGDLKSKFDTGDYVVITDGSGSGSQVGGGTGGVVDGGKSGNTIYVGNYRGVYLVYNAGENKKLQTGNQFLTFRVRDVYNGDYFYKAGDQSGTNYLSYDPGYVMNTTQNALIRNTKAWMYPVLENEYSLCNLSNNISSYLTLLPNSETIIPIAFEYVIRGSNDTISKTMSLDIRTSLYTDPICYTFKVTAKKESTMLDKMITINKNTTGESDYIQYNPTVFK